MALGLVCWHRIVSLAVTYVPGRDLDGSIRFFTIMPWMLYFSIVALGSAILGIANLVPYKLPPASAKEQGPIGTDGWIAFALQRQAIRLPRQRERFERFTPGLRAALKGAQDEALKRGHHVVTPDHMFLALLLDPDGPARRVLTSLGVDLAQLQEAIVAHLDQMPAETGAYRLSEAVKVVFHAMVEEARMGGHHLVGTEHALLGIVREGTSTAAQLLADQGVTLDGARSASAAGDDEVVTAS